MWGVCEVVEAQSNYKKSYLWWFRILACGDSTGSDRIEKDQVGVTPELVWGKGRKDSVIYCVCVCMCVCVCVCEAPLDDWTNGGSVGGSV